MLAGYNFSQKSTKKKEP